MSAEQSAQVKLAFARLFNDNPKSGDAMTVIADLVRLSGHYQPMSISQWMAEKSSAAGYEASCHEQNGKRAIVSRILSFASLTEDDVLRLEQIARYRPDGEQAGA